MNPLNKRYEKSFTLSSFKDPKQYSKLEEKIFQDLKKTLSKFPNWDFLEEKFDGSLIYEINKPKGFLNRMMDQTFKKNPYIELKISLEKPEDEILTLVMYLGQGGGFLGIKNSSDFMGSYLLSMNKNVKELTTNVQNTISNIVNESVLEFESTRVQKNTNIKNQILQKITNLEFKEEIQSLFITNQNLFSDDHIQKILKVIGFYDDNLGNYNNIFNKFQENEFVSKFQSEIDQTLELLPFMYNSVLIIEQYLSEMISSLINGDKVTYFSIYNVFEENGVFLTKGEKIIIDNTNKIVDQLNKLNSSMDVLISLTLTISEKLSSVNRKLSINNLLTGINTYQLYSINKKL
jgi:hypothetical protein